MRKNIALFVSLIAVALTSACADVDTTTQVPAQESEYKVWRAAIVMEQVADPNNPTATVWNPKACTPSDDS